MKKILALFLLPIILVFGVLGAFLYEPTWFINQKNITWILNRTDVLKQWSWKMFDFRHERKAWNDRVLEGSLTDFCFLYEGEAGKLKTCYEEISWHFHLHFSFREGLVQETLSPWKIRSSFTDFTLAEKKDEATNPPDIKGLWDLVFSDPVPDWDLEWKKITLHQQKPFDIPIVSSLKKKKDIEVRALDFFLKADPKGFTLSTPPRYPLPVKWQPALHFRDVKLRGEIGKEGIPLHLTGALEALTFDVRSFLDLPLEDSFGPLTEKKALLKTKGKIFLHGVKKNLPRFAPAPYHELPAPFNQLDGNIDIDIFTENLGKDAVLLRAKTVVNMEAPKGSLKFDLLTDVPLDLSTHSMGILTLELILREVLIPLPKLSKKSLPPQFMPDSRIVTKPPRPGKETAVPIDLDLKAEGEKALQLKSNLLDEPLRLNFDLQVRRGKLSRGYVCVLPLKTTVFKRPIRVEDLLIRFHEVSKPTLKSQIVFPLPEYKITLTLEGPLDDPRHAFSSEPLLPQSDIYAVLLFGRPLSDLDGDDKSAAQKTNQILSQGILSLSVLYFLSGSPVEYVGFDQESQSATAQFGLGKKSSLRIGGKESGVNEAGLRRSLGKGWYLDTSVQNNSTTTNATKNYGVLLERIIAY